jgi:hypothetical protein
MRFEALGICRLEAPPGDLLLTRGRLEAFFQRLENAAIERVYGGRSSGIDGVRRM